MLDRRVSLVKGEHTFVFTWNKAEQMMDLVNHFCLLANDPKSGFDWVDAQILAYQIGQIEVDTWNQEDQT